jgi:pimeloyl-ACP methyl ester carboxylesterase
MKRLAFRRAVAAAVICTLLTAFGGIATSYAAGPPTPVGHQPAAADVAPAGTAHPKAVFRPCGAGEPATTRCGTVSVPLDRVHPSGKKIAIAFQLYPASDTSAPALGTIVPSNGGPGVSNIASVGLWLFLLQPLLAHRNLLAIDHRGIGQSQAIDCAALQHVQGDQVAAARACGAQLGAASDRYGSADVADDVDAVRAALALDKIDYYGVSYGAVDVRAYAYRHPSHLRSAILDSPYNSQDAAFTRTLPSAMARISVLVCRRSPSCAGANPDAQATLNWLVQRVRTHPFTGTGFTADGKPQRVTVDESAILGVLYNDYFAAPAFLNQGEIFAAAKAFRRGDRTPLLRLVAESPAPNDFGNAAGSSSVGADYAVFCADSNFPWNKRAPEATREQQYQRALSRVPSAASAPFSIKAWTGFVASQPVLLIPGADACVPWPTPTRPEPPFPVNQPFPSNIPALLMGGGLDYLDINSERSLIPLFPGAPFVTVQNAGHVTTFWNPCATSIAVHFLGTLRTGDTSCAADTKGAMNLPGYFQGILQLQGVGRFPTRSAQEIPAKSVAGGHDHSTLADRQVAAVSWAAVVDAVYRLPRMTGATGRGLRGGTTTVATSNAATTITYHGVRFANDVSITGTASIDTTSKLSASVVVSGPCGRLGSLTIRAVLWNPAKPLATITGQLRGHRIAVFTQTR